MVLWLWFVAGALAAPEDDALEALADGRDAAARALLGRAVAAADDTDIDRLRCLQGRVAHATGAHAEAIAVLEAVPDDAACARQAGYVRAEALLALDRPVDASALYSELATSSLGPTRDAALVDDLVELADALLEDPARRRQGLQLLNVALSAAIGPNRALSLARGC